jgi:hypothetical protein
MNDRRQYVVSGFSRTLAERLKDGDPVVDEGAISDVDAQRMRRTIVDAASEQRIVHPIGSRASWAAITLAVAAIAIFAVNRWREPRIDAPVVPTSDVSQPAQSRRQLQFVAPGGTRVIWIFNADFKP